MCSGREENMKKKENDKRGECSECKRGPLTLIKGLCWRCYRKSKGISQSKKSDPRVPKQRKVAKIPPDSREGSSGIVKQILELEAENKRLRGIQGELASQGHAVLKTLADLSDRIKGLLEIE